MRALVEAGLKAIDDEEDGDEQGVPSLQPSIPRHASRLLHVLPACPLGRVIVTKEEEGRTPQAKVLTSRGLAA